MKIRHGHGHGHGVMRIFPKCSVEARTIQGDVMLHNDCTFSYRAEQLFLFLENRLDRKTFFHKSFEEIFSNLLFSIS